MIWAFGIAESPVSSRKDFLQRLFSTFANGWPGKGLVILRLAIATLFIHDSFAPLTVATSFWQTIPPVFNAILGALLLIGFWTPVAGALGALLQFWIVFSSQGEPWKCGLAAAIASGLAMLGPGAWSIDSIVYGRRRVSIRER